MRLPDRSEWLSGRCSVSLEYYAVAVRLKMAQTLFFGCRRPASCDGEVAEWSNAAVLKTVRRASVSGVRIPPSPPLIWPAESALTGRVRVWYRRHSFQGMYAQYQ